MLTSALSISEKATAATRQRISSSYLLRERMICSPFSLLKPNVTFVQSAYEAIGSYH